MKFLVDFLPVALFYAAYKLWGMSVATGVAIGAAVVQVAWGYWRWGRAENMHLVTMGLLLVFGGMTIVFKDPIFIMWKPTLLYWLFALAFLTSGLFADKPLIERMMSHAVDVDPPIWSRLNWMWAMFCIASGLANLYVVYFYSGFYQAHQALMVASGIREFELSKCAESFSGTLLAQCEAVHGHETTWVNFKLFGMISLTILFVVAQGFYLARHIKDDEPTAETD